MNFNTVLESCISTNDEAKKLGEAGLPSGTWISTRNQTGGRGRQGREWKSGEENLYLSYLIRLEDKGLWTWVPVATAIGVIRALDRLDVRIQVKWPNDLYVMGAKLGGILCEGVGSKGQSFIVAGVGLNVNEAPSVEDRDTTSMRIISDRSFSVAEVRRLVIEELGVVFEELVQNGAPWIKLQYEQNTCMPAGTQVEWRDGDGTHGARVVGLGGSGELIVQSEGKTRKLYAEEVSVRPVI